MLKNASIIVCVKKAAMLTILLVLASQTSFAQSTFPDFAEKSLTTQNRGMYVLGGWAIANIATGAYGWTNYNDDRMYFHQMNLMWNVFNLSIAGFGLYSNSQIDFATLSAEEIMASHLKTERILLINSALNVGYIGTGVLLRHLSASSAKNHDVLRGYGNSIILQGGFLLVFDLVLYQFLRTQRLDFVNSINLFSNQDITGFQIVLNL